MSTMSKTAALKEAQSAVSKPHRRSSSDYVVYAPYYNHDTSGPSMEMQADTYPRIVGRRSCKVARIALALMGVDEFDGADIAYEAQNYGYTSAKEIVEYALQNRARA